MTKTRVSQIMGALLGVVAISFIFFVFQGKDDNKISPEDNTLEQNLSSEPQREKKQNEFELKPNTKPLKQMSFAELSNSLYMQDGGKNIKEKINRISQNEGSNEDKAKASYLNSFIGDYKEAIEQRDKVCSDDRDLSYCQKISLDITSYRPEDMYDNILTEVEISMPGVEKSPLKGKKIFSVYNQFVHRIKLSKKGYLDFYEKIVLDSIGTSKHSLNPKFVKADKMVEISGKTPKILETQHFDFQVSTENFTDTSGNTVDGKIEVFLFDISEEDGNINALNLDAFDTSGNYIGSSMVTHGMPLIKAYKGKEELKITQPILGRGKILHLEKAEGINLEGVPKNQWLDKETLDTYNVPPFWHLDQQNGVWESGAMKILDTSGRYEFQLW